MGTGGSSDFKIWVTVFLLGAALVGVGIVFGVPLIEQVVTALDTGVGLKTAGLWSFGVTVVLFVLFAVVAGDGLIGELQFMLGGFFLFFMIFTVLIAWIF